MFIIPDRVSQCIVRIHVVPARSPRLIPVVWVSRHGDVIDEGSSSPTVNDTDERPRQPVSAARSRSNVTRTGNAAVSSKPLQLEIPAASVNHRKQRRFSAPAVDAKHLLPSGIRLGGGGGAAAAESVAAGEEERVVKALSNFPKFAANTPSGLTSADSNADVPSPKHVVIWRDSVHGTRVFSLPGPGEENEAQDVEIYGSDESTYIAKFMQHHRCYELMPYSSKLILFDVELEVICAFYAMLYNGIKAAPVWNGKLHKFVGVLTVTDFIRILLRCYQRRGKFEDIEKHRITDWRELLYEDMKPDIVVVEPGHSLYEAILSLRNERVHRLLVVDNDDGSALYILTYKRILRYLYQSARNLPRPQFMSKSIGELDVGTYQDIVTVTLKSRLIDTLNLLMERRISAVPVVNGDKRLVNIYSKYDVVNLARDKMYANLECSIDEALRLQRDTFEGLYTCKKTDSLENVIHWFVKAEVHRMVVVDAVGRVEGIVSLSDLIHCLVLPTDDDADVDSESSDEIQIEQF